MTSTSHSTQSVWLAEAGDDAFAPLSKNTSADVCIVGAGISGLSIAYALCKEGKSVVVLDAGTTGGGETSHTTAHLVNALDDRYWKLEWFHGEEGARLAAESHTAAVDRIEAIVAAEKIACDFERVDGYLFVPKEDSADELHKELAAIHRAGLSNVKFLRDTPLIGPHTGPCLHFPNQAQFHPMKYLRGLSKAIIRMGGRIHAKSRVQEMVGGEDAHVETISTHRVSARSIVIATNTPVNNRVVIHTKQAGYQTYVVGLQIPRSNAIKALFWDTLDPYHYVRFCRAHDDDRHDILIVGGEDHKTGQAEHPEDRFIKLEKWAHQHFPSAGETIYHWSGEVMEPQDGLAYIGRNPMDESNVYVVTGDSGNGMTHGTIAGMLVPDLILGRENPWAKLYEPSRKSVRSLLTFMKENLNTAAQYVDWVTPGETASPDEVRKGEGAVIRKGLKKIALYRDEKGELHQMSATCPHLKGIVEWNSAEKTWDCPCHGSRFKAATGEVIHGPSLSGLQPIQE